MLRSSVDVKEEEGPSNPRWTRRRIPPPPPVFDQDDDQSSGEESGNDDEEEEEEAEEPSEEEEQEEEEDDDDDDNEEEDGSNGSNQTMVVAGQQPPIFSNGTGNSAVVGPIKNGAIWVTLTDPEVLDCPICYDSLTIPVFQCENGHIACSSCCGRLVHKCPSCSLPIGHNRCRAIEKVLESVKLPCQNLKYGCKEMVSYSKKSDHDKICNNAPCSCPLSGCSFVGSSRQLYHHVSGKHKDSASLFRYNNPFPIFFTCNDKSLVLQEKIHDVVFILKNTVEILGNVMTVTCMAPPSSKRRCFYELEARKEGSNLRFESCTKNIQKVSYDDPHEGEFLVVPGSFFGEYGRISLNLCIWRHGSRPTETRSTALSNSKQIPRLAV